MFAEETRRPIMAMALGALVALGACGDQQQGEDIAGPAIPTLEEKASVGDVASISETMDAQCSCAEWGCSIYECGYDPPSDPRGPCCLECTTGTMPPAPEPTCEPDEGGGEQGCSDQLGAGEYGVDFCNGEPEDWCSDTVCPAEFVCCYGGPFGDGPY